MTTTAVDIQWQLDKVLEHGWCVEGGEGRRREARWGYEDVTAVVLSCGQSLDIPILDESRHDSRCLIQSKDHQHRVSKPPLPASLPAIIAVYLSLLASRSDSSKHRMSSSRTAHFR
jgi:hypothetical protein